MRRRELMAVAGAAVCVALTACVPRSEAQAVEFEVHGMSCESCVQGITHQVSQLEGVLACEVDLEGERARVRYDPGRIDVATIEASIDRLGYEATVLPAGG